MTNDEIIVRIDINRSTRTYDAPMDTTTSVHYPLYSVRFGLPGALFRDGIVPAERMFRAELAHRGQHLWNMFARTELHRDFFEVDEPVEGP